MQSKFTDKFLRVPVRLYYQKDVEVLGDSAEYYESVEMIDPHEIQRYYKTEDKAAGECVQIFFKCGNGVVTYMTVDEFEQILNNFSPVTLYQKQ